MDELRMGPLVIPTGASRWMTGGGRSMALIGLVAGVAIAGREMVWHSVRPGA
jgi:hypothetical protein